MRLKSLFLFILITFCSSILSYAGRKVTILFTSDIHSEADNYASIASIIEEKKRLSGREGSALLVLDAGDIAMGTVFHCAFDSHALEYRAMARMGYDAIAYGNHDFDFGEQALQNMYLSAWKKDSLMKFPALLSANLFSKKISDVFASEGKAFLGKYKIFERGGVKIGVFGVFGEDAYNVVGRDRDKLVFKNAVEESKKVVKELKDKGVDYIVAISHGGTLNGDDIKLAKGVAGINVIISGHDHDLTDPPVIVNNTYVIAPGAGGEYVGELILEDGKLKQYKKWRIDNAGPKDVTIAKWVDSVKVIVNDIFLKTCGVNLSDTITCLNKDILRKKDAVGKMKLGDLIADGYRKAVIENLSGIDTSCVVGLVPYGVIRESLHSGAVTYNDAFNVLPLGSNANGYTGYPLVYAFLNGDELEDVCEMNATLAPYIEDVRMFFSGLEYETGKWRLPFFKVKKVFVNGKPVQKDKLYLVVTGEYTAKLVGTLKRESYGILSATLKDKKGAKADIEKLPVIKDKNGNIITEWLSFARYLRHGVK